MVEAATAKFEEIFGGKPEWLSQAPGRINLMGDHTDYNEGFVMPMAIAQRVVVVAREVNGPTRLASADIPNGPQGGRISLGPEESHFSLTFDARSVQPGEVHGWGAYPAGVAWALGGAPNLEAVVVSNLAMGKGVSSSAALEVAFAAVWNAVAGFGLDPVVLAKAAQRAENEFVGMRCGLMDQLASALGRPGHAMRLDMRSLECLYVPLPAGLAVVRCDTGTPRQLTESAYNERRSQCETAATRLGLRSLRDANFEDLDRLDGIEKRRARHVISENARVLTFAEALAQGDRVALGRLMHESHASLRDDYEASSPGLDAMVEAACEAPGCVGVRMTGAGFGGSCAALVDAGKVTWFVEEASRQFSARFAAVPSFEPCEPFGGVDVSQM